MAQEGLEPSASLVLGESGLPFAYRAGNSCARCPGWESNPQAPGFKPGRSAVGVPGPTEVENRGTRTHGRPVAATCFKTGPSSGRVASERAYTRVPGAGLEPAAS